MTTHVALHALASIRREPMPTVPWWRTGCGITSPQLAEPGLGEFPTCEECCRLLAEAREFANPTGEIPF